MTVAVPGADPAADLSTVTPSGRRGLTATTGLAGLSLDAMASVSYGPEAIVLVLAAAGAAGMGMTLPVTAAIAALLLVLIASYRQVIAAFPEGGGAYAVAKKYLGARAGLVAAASLIVDYVLNVAVSVAAGVAALTSAFPAANGMSVEICLAVTLGITVLNLFGIVSSARAFMVPTAVFVIGIFVVIVGGLLREGPAAAPAEGAVDMQTVGILLLLKAFSSGCAALTGVEAIANAVPSFAEPRVRRAQHAEVALGTLLGTMLIGLAVLIEKFDIRPSAEATVLSQLTSAALGDGFGYYTVQFATIVLLAMAANTSYGGLPTLARLLADDNYLPHRFSVASPRRVYRYGVIVLGVGAAMLLAGFGGEMNDLVPLFAIGVFIGFTLAQVGMVRHWWWHRCANWQTRLLLNAFGAMLTASAAVITTAMKFSEGAWLIVVVLPLLVVVMQRIQRTYTRMDRHRGASDILARPRPDPAVVVVPVSAVSELSRRALSAALSMSMEVVAVHVVLPGEDRRTLERNWEAWDPGVPLVLLDDEVAVGAPVARFVEENFADRRTIIVIAEVDPPAAWDHLLPSHRSDELERRLRRLPDTMLCHLRLQTC